MQATGIPVAELALKFWSAEGVCAIARLSMRSSLQPQTLGKQFATLAGVQDWASSGLSSVIAIHAAVKTRFLDHLGNEPRTVDDLAAAAALNPERLGRLIGFLASQELLTTMTGFHIRPDRASCNRITGA